MSNTMTQEERRALFHKKAEAGRMRNDACNEALRELYVSVKFEGMDVYTALGFAWAKGCDYGKEHHEELKVFDK